jgi:7-carboxy-7-deazaguanine synthase
VVKVKEKLTKKYCQAIEILEYRRKDASCNRTSAPVLLAMQHAFIDEVFASIQGEGPSVGRRHIFVRFAGCDLRCRFCDTPGAARPEQGGARPCRVQISPGSFEREAVPNPVGTQQLSSLCGRLRLPGAVRPFLSLTGGEPLLQASFLRAWLPGIVGSFRIHLETSGVHADALRTIAGMVDVVSMDLKLPSATGELPRWEEHREFLKAAAGRETVVKAVVTAGTRLEDLALAARIVAEHDRRLPFIIQPASGVLAPHADELVAMQDHVLATLDDVRVIPQVHRLLKVP